MALLIKDYPNDGKYLENITGRKPIYNGYLMAKKKILKIQWKGDLDDDCSAMVGNLSAHCESLGEYDKHFENWYCSVAPVDKAGFVNGPDLFHSSESGGAILGGTMARAICEAILKAAS